MKKRIVSILLSMVLTITFFPSYVFAEDTMNYSYSDVYNNNGEKIGVCISGSSQTASGTINIPSEYNGYPVVEIASLNAKNVTCYVIPASVTSIRAWAFNTYEGQLSSIEVESGNQNYTSVDGVLYNADMTALIRYPVAKSGSSFTVPNGVTEILQNAFLYIANLTEINFPSSVSSVGMQAFYFSKKLEAVNVDSGSSSFSSQNGVLYDKNKTTLVYYPYNKKDVTSFTVPEGITTVSNYAFENGVNEIILPSTVNTIYSLSFSKWNHNITVSSDNPNFKSINGSVFSKDMTKFIYHYFTGVDSYTVPNGVTDIGDIFSNCNYSSIILPEGITTIEKNAFSNCNNLKEIYLPSTIKAVEDYAFKSCNELVTVNFAGSTSQWDGIDINQYGNEAILNAEIICSNGTPSVPVEPAWVYEGNTLTVTYDGKMCDYSHSSRAPWFSDSRYSIESIVFEGNPVTIGKYAFYSFYRVEKVAIPEGITTIGESSFESCALKEIALPTSLQSIGKNAFRYNNIESVYYSGSEEDWNKINGNDQLLNAEIIFNQSGFPVDSLEWEFADGTLIVDGSGNMPDYDSYSNIVPWNDHINEIYKIVVKGNFKNIGNNAFSNMPLLEEAVLPISIKKIGYEVFKGCNSLKNITIPQKVTTIESSAFSGCTSLESITIPENVTNLSSYAFSGCSALETITISEGVTNIGFNCFEDCVSLESVTLPKTLSLSDNAFSNCTSLKEIKVAEGNTNLWTVDDILFGKNYDNSTILLCYPAGKTDATYEIPNDVTTLNNSFKGNKYIKTITGGEGLKYINGAFGDCSSLSNISLSDTIEYISSGTFTGCTSFKQLVIPAGITEISGILNGSSIEEVTIPASISHIEPYMLESALSLKNINVDESNSSYTSIDGVLFSKDKKTLIFYPKGKDDSSYSIPTETESIGEGAFSENSHIIKLVISGDVRNIPDYAFSGFSQLNEVVIEKGLTTIPNGAFYGCRNLSKITIPVTVTTVGDSAFNLGRSESALPVEVIYEGTQSSWDNIDVSSRNGDVFDSENISFVIGIGDGVDWILKGNEYLLITGNGDMTDFASENEAPWYNADWTGDYLGEIYKRIEAVWIDGGITAIGDNAFTSSYTALTDIYFDGTMEEWESVVIGNGNDALLNATVHCNDDALGTLEQSGTISQMKWSLYDSGTLVISSEIGITPSYYNVDYTNPCFPEEIQKSVKKLIVEDGVTTIGRYLFALLPMLYEVELPDTITTIESNAFYYCEKLTRINFPRSLTTIKGFNNCALREFNIPSSVTVLDEMQGNLFIEATIPSNVSSISNRLFSNCPLLEEINIGKNTNITLTSINHYTGGYIYNTNIKAVNVHPDNPYLYSIDGVLFTKADDVLRHYPTKKEDLKYTTPSSTKAIGAYSFENVEKYLSILTISEGVENIEDYGISGCAIKEINLPKSLKSIGNNGINGDIVNINISEGLESIGEYGISSPRLEHIILPKSLQKIGPSAFRGCSSLESVSIPDGVTSIGEYAFADCNRSFAVKIPSSVTQIGKNAFYNYDYYSGSLLVYYGGTKEKLYELINNETTYFRPYGSIYCYCLVDGYKHLYLKDNNDNNFGIFIDVPMLSDSYNAGIEFIKGDVTETRTFYSNERYGAYICSSFYADHYDFSMFKLFLNDGEGNPIIESEIYSKPFKPDSVAFKSCNFNEGTLNAVITYDMVSQDCVMILAIYNEGKLVELHSKPVSSVQTKTIFNVSTDNDLSNMEAKAFLWESLSNMKPIGFVAKRNISGVILESEHDYGVDVDETKIYTYNGECSSIDVTFSAETYVENNWDYIYIYDGNDNLIGKYTGSSLANATVRVPGNTVKIRLISDYAVCGYGYKTESIVINK